MKQRPFFRRRYQSLGHELVACLRLLLIHGTQDERFTPGIIRWVLSNDHWPEGLLTVEKFNGTHFALIHQRHEVQEIIFRWLEKGRTAGSW